MNKYAVYDNYLKEQPDAKGYFGPYGGSYLPEKLVPAFQEIEQAYKRISQSAQFIIAPDSPGIPGASDAGVSL